MNYKLQHFITTCFFAFRLSLISFTCFMNKFVEMLKSYRSIILFNSLIIVLNHDYQMKSFLMLLDLAGIVGNLIFEEKNWWFVNFSSLLLKTSTWHFLLEFSKNFQTEQHTSCLAMTSHHMLLVSCYRGNSDSVADYFSLNALNTIYHRACVGDPNQYSCDNLMQIALNYSIKPLYKQEQ